MGFVPLSKILGKLNKMLSAVQFPKRTYYNKVIHGGPRMRSQLKNTCYFSRMKPAVSLHDADTPSLGFGRLCWLVHTLAQTFAVGVCEGISKNQPSNISKYPNYYRIDIQQKLHSAVTAGSWGTEAFLDGWVPPGLPLPPAVCWWPPPSG